MNNWVIGAIFAGFAAAIIAIACAGAQEQADFMASCQRDHKPYECTAMWRAGEHAPVYALPLTSH